MRTFVQDLRFGARMLGKNPGVTAAIVLTIALGIGATTAIFSVVYSVLLRPLPFPEADRLVMVFERPPNSDRRNPAAIGNFQAWKERNQVFESIAALQEIPTNLLGGDEPVQVTGIAAAADFFRVLRVAPLLGRTFTTDADSPAVPRTAVLSHALWQQRFGGRTDVIGQRISINGAHHEIVGVMPAGMAFPSRRWQVCIPLRSSRDEGRNFLVIARLKPGSTREAAQTAMDIIAMQTARERPTMNANWGATVVPLHEHTVGSVRRLVSVLFAAVAFILLIACANVANLLLMRAVSRSREIAIRVALGARRRRVVRQLIVESLIFIGPGAVLGVVLARQSLQWVFAMLPAGFPLPRMNEIVIDGWVLLFSAAVSLAAGVVFGVMPAFQWKRLELGRGIQHSGRTAAPSSGVRNTLVVTEVALALLLVAGAGLMVRSLLRLNRVDPGFRSDHVLTLRMLLLPVRDRAVHAEVVDDVLQRVRALPDVAAAGSIGVLPITGTNTATWYYPADQAEPQAADRPSGDVSIITPGYFQAMAIPLLKGRDFDGRDRRGSPHVGILNQTAARRFFGDGNPLGKRLTVSWNDAREVEVVGVVADIRHKALQAQPEPCLFLPNAQQPFPLSSVVIRTAGEPLAVAAAVKEQVRQVDSDQGVAEIVTMESLISESMAQPRLQTMLFGLFGVIALALASVGIYSVISYSVTQRMHEIGVRLALGAAPALVFRLVVSEALRLTTLGLAAGFVAALGLTRFLQNLLYEVEATDLTTFAAVGTLLLFVAAGASCLPALRATRVDPAVVLREE